MARRPIRGIIFDLDGTLVDSRLDFDAMRCEMGLPAGQPILESLERLNAPERQRCEEILRRHEWEGAQRAALMPGAADFLARLAPLRLQQAVLTRNSRAMALATLERVGLRFHPLMAREDAPVKPDPTAIRRICQSWTLAPEQVVMLGDYLFDLQAGRAAGAQTVLYARGRSADELPYADLADFVLSTFHDGDALLDWMAAGR